MIWLSDAKGLVLLKLMLRGKGLKQIEGYCSIQVRDNGGLNQEGYSGDVMRSGQILDMFGR